jgi:hypothetical protein
MRLPSADAWAVAGTPAAGGKPILWAPKRSALASASYAGIWVTTFD